MLMGLRVVVPGEFGVGNKVVVGIGYGEAFVVEKLFNLLLVLLVHANVLMDLAPAAAYLAAEVGDGFEGFPVQDFDISWRQ